jgi:hypothetical protein
MAAAVVIIILIVCMIFVIGGGLYVYKMRDQEGDTCTGDDPNAKYTLDENLECRFATCAPGFEINENGTCVFIAEEEAKTELELARKELEVKKSALQQEKLVSDEVKAQAVTELTAAEARLEAARLAIEEAKAEGNIVSEALEVELTAAEARHEATSLALEEAEAEANAATEAYEVELAAAEARLEAARLAIEEAEAEANAAVLALEAEMGRKAAAEALEAELAAAAAAAEAEDDFLGRAKEVKIYPWGYINKDPLFGRSVSISGDGNTTIVSGDGSGQGIGAAWIFARSGDSWLQDFKLDPSDGYRLGGFGHSVAISEDGNTIIVGASSQGGGVGKSSAYIFIRNHNIWTQQAKIPHPKPSDHAMYFGWSVSISGDGNTVIVGAPSAYNGGGAGSAYIFTRSGDSWSQQRRIQASDAQPLDRFGESVSISGDGKTVIVGAVPVHGGGAGSAYIFTRSGDSWSQQRRIQASDAQPLDRFGYSVAISGDGNTVIVSSRHNPPPRGPPAAYIFTRSGDSWLERAKLQDTSTKAQSYFGDSVSISSDGNTAIVGAPGDTNDAAGRVGATYIYTRSDDSWPQRAKIGASDTGGLEQFGQSVSISGDGNTIISSVPTNPGYSKGGPRAHILDIR